MKIKRRTLDKIANLICGNPEYSKEYFVYRSSSYLTRFFQDCDMDVVHDGSTRAAWAESRLQDMLDDPPVEGGLPPQRFCEAISLLMDPSDATGEGRDRPNALEILNNILASEGLEAFFDSTGRCHLRRTSNQSITTLRVHPHRPLSPAEKRRREAAEQFVRHASEDQIIEEILLPLFRDLGFQRITVAGHKDKALEYGKDLWMKYTLPTQHVLYFGVQVKKGKIDSSGAPRGSNKNVAEILNQVTMMLGHEIFDPEIGKRALVDHAFIVAGGEITKSARNWLGNKLDSHKRSQIMFMDRTDIVNLCAVTSFAIPNENESDLIPF